MFSGWMVDQVSLKSRDGREFIVKPQFGHEPKVMLLGDPATRKAEEVTVRTVTTPWCAGFPRASNLKIKYVKGPKPPAATQPGRSTSPER